MGIMHSGRTAIRSKHLRQVKRLKPFYSEAQIALGISKAKEFLFKPTQKDLEDLKKETGIWQRASLKTLEH